MISKGHPLGATGLAQCSELCWQLRGEADKRQVNNAQLALQHNIGLGGAVVVALYRLGFPEVRKPVDLSVASPPSSKPKQAAGNSKYKATPDGFIVTPYISLLEQAMQEDKENLVEKVRGIYGFKVTNGPEGAEGFWIINAKTGKGSITYNGTG